MTSPRGSLLAVALAARIGRGATAVLLWAIPSSWVLDKFLGRAGATAAAAIACFCIPLTLDAAQRLDRRRTGWLERHAFGWMTLLLIAAFLVLFPLAKTGILGPGSDRDDALNVALGAMLHGHYPYYAQTYLGNPPTSMPGALLLALPFFMLGTSALQNLFWLPAFTGFAASLFDRRNAAAAYLLVSLIGCPASMQDFVTGGDFLVNCLYVIVAAELTMRAAAAGRPLRDRAAAYVLLSICLSSRPIFVVLVPILAAYLRQQAGGRRAVEFSVAVAAIVAVINGPFYWYDPAYFPALNLFRKLALPPELHGEVLVPAAALGLASVAFVVRMTPARVYGIAAASLSAMLLAVPVCGLLMRGDLSVLVAPGYSLPVSIFTGLWLLWPQPSAASPEQDPAASGNRWGAGKCITTCAVIGR